MFYTDNFYLAMVCAIVVLFILYIFYNTFSYCLLKNWIPIKRRQTVFPTGSRGIQTQLEKLSEDIQEVKSEIKKFHDLAFRHKFSVSFLLELEETFSCIICRRIPARKPLIACSECNSLIDCQKCVNEW